ncbi:hypothetical protein GCM10007105_06680 [Shewanella chilikensis]|nr:hypothetical protein GCM10007105_06680 [Shewanella chilikensis]
MVIKIHIAVDSNNSTAQLSVLKLKMMFGGLLYGYFSYSKLCLYLFRAFYCSAIRAGGICNDLYQVL